MQFYNERKFQEMELTQNGQTYIVIFYIHFEELQNRKIKLEIYYSIYIHEVLAILRIFENESILNAYTNAVVETISEIE